MEKKGKVSNIFCLEAVAMENLEAGLLEAGHPVWYLWEHIWFSLVAPKLEAGVKIREAVSY